MNFVKKILKFLGILPSDTKRKAKTYFRHFNKYTFVEGSCESASQYEASITKLYHAIEKGLAYNHFRAGFGEKNILALLDALEKYAGKYEVNVFFYQTALSVLHRYIEKNKEFGWENTAVEKRIAKLPGSANHCGGEIKICPKNLETVKNLNFEDFIKDRHSIRHFSSEPVDMKLLYDAIGLAQFTPSACNRQGWKCHIIDKKGNINEVLRNQNGNKGFGEEIDKLLLVTADLCYFNKNREVYQPYIDGGMYASNILHALHFYGIGSIPLSASLSMQQEKNIRNLLNITDNEVFILFIGVGVYPSDEIFTTRSERKPPNITVH